MESKNKFESKNVKNIEKKEIKKKTTDNKKIETRKRKIFIIATITGVLIFTIYVFISQFIMVNNIKPNNSTLVITDYNPS